MPLRTLLILIALAVVFLAVKRLFPPARTPKKKQLKHGNMVQCAHCGIYLPEPEAAAAEGRLPAATAAERLLDIYLKRQ